MDFPFHFKKPALLVLSSIAPYLPNRELQVECKHSRNPQTHQSRPPHSSPKAQMDAPLRQATRAMRQINALIRRNLLAILHGLLRIPRDDFSRCWLFLLGLCQGPARLAGLGVRNWLAAGLDRTHRGFAQALPFEHLQIVLGFLVATSAHSGRMAAAGKSLAALGCVHLVQTYLLWPNLGEKPAEPWWSAYFGLCLFMQGICLVNGDVQRDLEEFTLQQMGVN